MSKISEYNIDLWNAAFEIKSIATKWGVEINDVYNHLAYCLRDEQGNL